MSILKLQPGGSDIIYGTSTVVVGPNGIGFYPFSLKQIDDENVGSFIAFVKVPNNGGATISLTSSPSVQRVGETVVTAWHVNNTPIKVERSDRGESYKISPLPN